MARKKHRLEEVLRSLRKKNDVSIDGTVIYILTDTIYQKGETVVNPHKKFDLGNGSWGKISYLTNVHNYSIVKVGTFPKMQMSIVE